MTRNLTFNPYIRSMDEQFSLYEWFARQYGLQRKSMQILFWIKRYPEMTGDYITQKMLAQKTYSSKQVVNAAIKSWRQKGYLQLLENPRDKRHKFIRLTTEGQSWAEEIYQKISFMENRAAAELSKDEQDLLNKLTIKYNAALKQEMEKMYD
ncbi:MarR family winged helix-turn-helix transcriptional regulator [Streptococcus halotolerans]|uniref:MarR family winged helix-turn-helix transcriptional regulator n=1 Tax=Streptococcus halotolerans TaxID=1814128 RepID=UPI0007874A39|nr:MarR family winged helix-turn-helix transcriptional regulator [Streptococcus halotolerans]